MEDDSVSTASLALLKGGKAKSETTKTVETELEKTDTAATAAPAKSNISFKKSPPKAAPEPEPVKEPEPEAVNEAAEASTEETIEVENMSAKELDKLVEDNEIEVPTEWKGWKVGEKRKWLNDQFGGDENDATETVEDVAEETKVQGKPEVEEAEVVKETPAPTKTKTTKASGKAAVKSLSGEVEMPDELSDMVHEIENLKEKDAKGLVRTLAENAEFSSFKLGGVLSVIQSNGWFAPYASFREYIEKEHGIGYRKAMYWVDVYNKLSESKVPWAKVKHIGWTKLKEIASILTLENVDKWVEIAEKSTTLQLIDTIQKSKQEGAPKALEDQTSTTVTTKTFKVHEDQKKTIETALEKAKAETGTAADTVALEHICLDYVGGGKKVSLKDQLVKMGVEAAINLLGEAYPKVEIEVKLPEDE